MMSPQLDEIDGGALNVHSKVFFADDRLLSIGSANLSNRSMACDTECNLSIEAVGDEHERVRIAAAIARMRARLLAEHLAEVPEVVQKVLSEKGLLSATKQLSQRPRRLVELDPLAVPELDALIPQQSLFDPEEPIDPEALIARWVPRESRKPFSRRFVVMLILSLLLIVGVIVSRYTPAQAYLNLYP
jgi:phosphatidylserine/phosphatidylglycerophosphate/cardiolipin synthase-like enzyme